MLHAKTAVMLMVAFVLPGAAKALGLGEIHVKSALNEPLAAEVDIVGATPEDLAGIKASIASDEAFRRFGFERPAFLSTSVFRVSMNGRGEPVLVIRSTGSFTEPLINMLIDLRWRDGELVREYTLLLDPPTLGPDTRFAEADAADSGPAAYAAPATAAATSDNSRPALAATSVAQQSPTVDTSLQQAETVEVSEGATLRKIAARVSSRSNAGTERMAVAIFHANPEAFAGNMNRLRLGAILTIPSPREVSAISAAEASNEIQRQMEAWHASVKVAAPVKAVPATVPAADASSHEAVIAVEPVSARQEATSKPAPDSSHSQASTAENSDEAPLSLRVQQLEQGLKGLLVELDHENQTLAGIKAKIALADKVVPAAAARSGHSIAASMVVILVLASGILGWYFLRRRGQALDPPVTPAVPTTQVSGALRIPELPVSLELARARSARNELSDTRIVRAPDVRAPDAKAASHSTRTVGGELAGDHRTTPGVVPARAGIQAADTNAETTPLEAVRVDASEATVNSAAKHTSSAAPAEMLDVDTAKLRYKMLDLDGTVYHVPMPSTPYQKAGFQERRTSLVDVLKVAVSREPGRRDLRVKLLETYYAAAATSLHGFLEVAQGLAGERANMTEAEWTKIALMGRQIAADSDLFAADFA
jgi:pilus assembly protein FimV